MVIWLYDRLGYLRKSRQDDPSETIEEVLAKHEAILQEYCEREFGGRIPPENLYKEVVSGESIDERVEVLKVLSRFEDPAIKGVVVVEPSRLSRGDLSDCARLINALRFSKTEVNTPMMTYNLENKMERKFFQDELLRGNDFLEYTKEILFRGRVAAAKRGCFIGNYAPYGYDKIKIGKDHTLTPNDDADVVRLIFKLYTEDLLTPGKIAKRLNDLGIAPLRAEEWKKDTVRHMLRNPHYAGKVQFNKIKITPTLENGVVKTKKLTQADEDIILAEGKHPAIIDPETWEKAQELIARNPRVRHEYELKNHLSGVITCAKCGRLMYIHSYKHAEDRFECRTKPRCYKSVKVSEVMEALIYGLEHSELPKLQMKVKNGDGNARKIQEKRLAKLEAQMEEYRAQEENQYELLETKKYTQDVFDRRNAALREKMEECQAAIYKARTSLPQNVNYEERILALQDAIAILKDTEATPLEKNRIVKAIIERVEFSGSESVDHTKRKGVKQGLNPFTLDITLRL